LSLLKTPYTLLRRITFFSSTIYVLLFYLLSYLIEYIIIELNYEYLLFYSNLTIIIFLHSLILSICTLFFLSKLKKLKNITLPYENILKNTFGVIIISFLFVFFVETILGYTVLDIEEQVNYSLYELISIAMINPIIEELFFRKFLANELRKNYNIAKGVIFSSILFALAHLPHMHIMIVAFFGGIIAAIIFFKTKNILYPILFHILWNTLTIISILKI
jgi:membrane protease YdiL (CAAX protease family)